MQPKGYFGQNFAKAKYEVNYLNQHFKEKSFPKMLWIGEKGQCLSKGDQWLIQNIACLMPLNFIKIIKRCNRQDILVNVWQRQNMKYITLINILRKSLSQQDILVKVWQKQNFKYITVINILRKSLPQKCYEKVKKGNVCPRVTIGLYQTLLVLCPGTSSKTSSDATDRIYWSTFGKSKTWSILP